MEAQLLAPHVHRRHDALPQPFRKINDVIDLILDRVAFICRDGGDRD